MRTRLCFDSLFVFVFFFFPQSMNNIVFDGDDNRNHVVEDLYKRYKSVNNPLFLEDNVNRIYEKAKKDSELYTVSKAEILQYKQSVQEISRSFHQRTLRNRARVLQKRSFKCYAPRNILLADILFLPRSLQRLSGEKISIVIFQDLFSRLVHLTPLSRPSSAECLKAFKNAMPFFGATGQDQYTKFLSDRG